MSLEELYKAERSLFLYAYSMNSMIAVFSLLNRTFISKLFTSIPETQQVLRNLLLPFGFYMVIQMNRDFIMNILRLKARVYFKVTSIMSGLVFPLLTFALNFYKVRIRGGNVYGILYSFISCDTAIYLLYVLCNC